MKTKQIREALTFDDVLILPRYSEVLPSDVSLASRFSRNVTLKAPIASSSMDTVTTHRVAIAMALEGGIGIIHRNMPILEEAEEVSRTKRYQSGMIVDPYTLNPEHTVHDAQALMRERNISGIPIVNGEGKLVGILTKRDIGFSTSSRERIENVMTKTNLVTASVGVPPEEAQWLLSKHRVEKLPLVDELFRLKGLITKKDIEKQQSHPHATKDGSGRLRVGASVGVTGDYFERAQELLRRGVDVLVIDSSHGDSKNVYNALLNLKKIPGVCDIVAGNIATAEAAASLATCGADGIKVGIGPGSICTTRIVTGCGVPQISALLWVREAIGDSSVPIIADGGIKYSGDITKAIAAGASAVMIGSLFAGTDESPGESVILEGRQYKVYRGMGSEAVLRAGGDRYLGKIVPEGIEGMVPDKGPLASVFRQLEGGLRQGMGYAGCRNIEEFHANAEFVRITPAGLEESHVHGVMVTKEAPNYPRP